MGKVKNYICLVDEYKKYFLGEKAVKRYRVGAHSPYEAKKLLLAKLGFCFISVYKEDTKESTKDIAKLGECYKEELLCKDIYACKKIK